MFLRKIWNKKLKNSVFLFVCCVCFCKNSLVCLFVVLCVAGAATTQQQAAPLFHFTLLITTPHSLLPTPTSVSFPSLIISSPPTTKISRGQKTCCFTAKKEDTATATLLCDTESTRVDPSTTKALLGTHNWLRTTLKAAVLLVLVLYYLPFFEKKMDTGSLPWAIHHAPQQGGVSQHPPPKRNKMLNNKWTLRDCSHCHEVRQRATRERRCRTEQGALPPSVGRTTNEVAACLVGSRLFRPVDLSSFADFFAFCWLPHIKSGILKLPGIFSS